MADNWTKWLMPKSWPQAVENLNLETLKHTDRKAYEEELRWLAAKMGR